MLYSVAYLNYMANVKSSFKRASLLHVITCVVNLCSSHATLPLTPHVFFPLAQLPAPYLGYLWSRSFVLNCHYPVTHIICHFSHWMNPNFQCGWLMTSYFVPWIVFWQGLKKTPNKQNKAKKDMWIIRSHPKRCLKH